MTGEELKNDLATILDVRTENLVETLTVLLSKLNDTGVELNESLTLGSATDAAEAPSGAISATAVAAAAIAAAAEQR
jgi:ribosomal protein L12E/L44/L45/RPP1/RPP2